MRRGRGGEGASLKFIEPSAVTVVPLSGSHVAAFAADRLVTVPGASQGDEVDVACDRDDRLDN
jgi:hypothetical protein